ncbi:hypothetical protein YC2023_123960 [Brassica napus]
MIRQNKGRILAEKTIGHGLEADSPAVVVADLSGVCAWRPWRLSSGFTAPLGLIFVLVQDEIVTFAIPSALSRWHLSPMRVASPSRVRLGRKCWVWATPAFRCGFSVSCVNRGGDLALATLLHLWEMILEATLA